MLLESHRETISFQPEEFSPEARSGHVEHPQEPMQAPSARSQVQGLCAHVSPSPQTRHLGLSLSLCSSLCPLPHPAWHLSLWAQSLNLHESGAARLGGQWDHRDPSLEFAGNRWVQVPECGEAQTACLCPEHKHGCHHLEHSFLPCDRAHPASRFEPASFHEPAGTQQSSSGQWLQAPG